MSASRHYPWLWLRNALTRSYSQFAFPKSTTPPASKPSQTRSTAPKAWNRDKKPLKERTFAKKQEVWPKTLSSRDNKMETKSSSSQEGSFLFRKREESDERQSNDKESKGTSAYADIVDFEETEDSRTDQRKRLDRIKKDKMRRTMKESLRQKQIEQEERMRDRPEPKARLVPRTIFIPEGLTVAKLSDLMGVHYDHLAHTMRMQGFENTEANYILSAEIASMLVEEYNQIPIVESLGDWDLKPRPEPESWAAYPTRTPVVTIMGHVDHGKTTLLDSLRKTSVAANEAGGITQHIGAFSVQLPSGKEICFLDTPGHAAFSAMRARGAQATDIVILVVAADDGVMPQTIEAIKHTQQAQVPMIVAINKCDKPTINKQKIKQELLEHGVELEEFGGDIQAVEISALKGTGLVELEEAVLALAEMSDLRGDPEGPAEGVIIESQMDRRKGNIATVLVKRGTLKIGSCIAAGTSWCKVKRMVDDTGANITEAGPSKPVQVMGWKQICAAGDVLVEAESEDVVKKVVEQRLRIEEMKKSAESIDAQNEIRLKQMADRENKVAARNRQGGSKNQMDDAIEQDQEQIPSLSLIIKADVHGSLEAILGSIEGLPQHQVKVRIAHSGIGSITDSDIEMASATGAEVISFNTRTEKRILAAAQSLKVGIHEHNIIYSLLDKLKELMVDKLPEEIVEEMVGEATVLQVFDVQLKGKLVGKIAGCRITNGTVYGSNPVKVTRNDKVVWEGSMQSFKHVRKDIKEAAKGSECGIGLNGFDDFEPGDKIKSIQKVAVRPKLT